MKHRLSVGPWVALLALSACMTLPVIAQETPVAPTANGELGGFGLSSAETLDKGTVGFGFYINNFDRMVTPVSCLMPPLTSDWAYDRTRVTAGVTFGVTDNLEVGFIVPYEDLDGDRENRIGFVNGVEHTEEIEVQGAANVRVSAKWRFLERGKSKLALDAFVELPTGDDVEGVAPSDTGFGLGLDWSHGKWLFNVGYHDQGDHDNRGLAESYEGGVGYIAPMGERLDWITELSGATFDGGGENTHEPDFVDLTSGIRYWFGKDRQWAFSAAARFNVTDYGDTDGFGGLVGVTYTPGLFRGRSAAKRKAEMEQQRQAEEEQARAAEEARRRAEEEARRAQEAAEAEARRRQAAEEAERARQEAERRRQEEERLVAPEPPKEEITTIQFDSGSARLSNIAKAKLDETALKMKQDPELRARILGYSDSQGPESANRAMSQRRAQAAKDYLVTRHGIDGARIEVEGLGSADPVASNDTAAGREQNRRAVVILRIE